MNENRVGSERKHIKYNSILFKRSSLHNLTFHNRSEFPYRHNTTTITMQHQRKRSRNEKELDNTSTVIGRAVVLPANNRERSNDNINSDHKSRPEDSTYSRAASRASSTAVEMPRLEKTSELAPERKKVRREKEFDESKSDRRQLKLPSAISNINERYARECLDSNMECIDVYCPHGKLGISIQSRVSGDYDGWSTIYDIKDYSSLAGLISVGDRIVAIDDLDVRGNSNIPEILASRSGALVRKITVFRSTRGGRGAGDPPVFLNEFVGADYVANGRIDISDEIPGNQIDNSVEESSVSIDVVGGGSVQQDIINCKRNITIARSSKACVQSSEFIDIIDNETMQQDTSGCVMDGDTVETIQKAASKQSSVSVDEADCGTVHQNKNKCDKDPDVTENRSKRSDFIEIIDDVSPVHENGSCGISADATEQRNAVNDAAAAEILSETSDQSDDVEVIDLIGVESEQKTVGENLNDFIDIINDNVSDYVDEVPSKPSRQSKDFVDTVDVVSEIESKENTMNDLSSDIDNIAVQQDRRNYEEGCDSGRRQTISSSDNLAVDEMQQSKHCDTSNTTKDASRNSKTEITRANIVGAGNIANMIISAGNTGEKRSSDGVDMFVPQNDALEAEKVNESYGARTAATRSTRDKPVCGKDNVDEGLPCMEYNNVASRPEDSTYSRAASRASSTAVEMPRLEKTSELAPERKKVRREKEFDESKSDRRQLKLPSAISNINERYARECLDSNMECIDVYCPHGKLGISIQSRVSGDYDGWSTIYDIKDYSSLAGLISVGDRIVAIDDLDVRGNSNIPEILASRSGALVRKITVFRSTRGGRGAGDPPVFLNEFVGADYVANGRIDISDEIPGNQIDNSVEESSVSIDVVGGGSVQQDIINCKRNITIARSSKACVQSSEFIDIIDNETMQQDTSGCVMDGDTVETIQKAASKQSSVSVDEADCGTVHQNKNKCDKDPDVTENRSKRSDFIEIIDDVSPVHENGSCGISADATEQRNAVNDAAAAEILSETSDQSDDVEVIDLIGVESEQKTVGENLNDFIDIINDNVSDYVDEVPSKPSRQSKDFVDTVDVVSEIESKENTMNDLSSDIDNIAVQQDRRNYEEGCDSGRRQTISSSDNLAVDEMQQSKHCDTSNTTKDASRNSKTEITRANIVGAGNIANMIISAGNTGEKRSSDGVDMFVPQNDALEAEKVNESYGARTAATRSTRDKPVCGKDNVDEGLPCMEYNNVAEDKNGGNDNKCDDRPDVGYIGPVTVMHVGFEKRINVRSCLCGNKSCPSILARWVMISDTKRRGYYVLPPYCTKGTAAASTQNALRTAIYRSLGLSKCATNFETAYIALHHFDPSILQLNNAGPLMLSRREVDCMKLGVDCMVKMYGNQNFVASDESYYPVPNYPWTWTVANVLQTENIYRLTYGINPEQAVLVQCDATAEPSPSPNARMNGNEGTTVFSERQIVDGGDAINISKSAEERQEQNVEKMKKVSVSVAAVAKPIDAGVGALVAENRSPKQTCDVAKKEPSEIAYQKDPAKDKGTPSTPLEGADMCSIDESHMSFDSANNDCAGYRNNSVGTTCPASTSPVMKDAAAKTSREANKDKSEFVAPRQGLASTPENMDIETCKNCDRPVEIVGAIETEKSKGHSARIDDITGESNQKGKFHANSIAVDYFDMHRCNSCQLLHRNNLQRSKQI